jgi:hypothetical protein
MTVRSYVLPYLGDPPVDRLDAGAVNALYRRLLSDGGRNGTSVFRSTVRCVHKVLSAALRGCVSFLAAIKDDRRMSPESWRGPAPRRDGRAAPAVHRPDARCR